MVVGVTLGSVGRRRRLPTSSQAVAGKLCVAHPQHPCAVLGGAAVAVDTSMAVLLTRIGLLTVGLADWICGFMSAVGSSNPCDVTRLCFDLWPHGCCRVLVGA